MDTQTSLRKILEKHKIVKVSHVKTILSIVDL